MSSYIHPLHPTTLFVSILNTNNNVIYFFHFYYLNSEIMLPGGSKPATLDTGAVVNVPLFVNTGDEILVDTRTGQYMSRA